MISHHDSSLMMVVHTLDSDTEGQEGYVMVEVFDSSMYYLIDVTMMLLAKVFRKVSNLGDKSANMSHRSSDLMVARCVVLVCVRHPRKILRSSAV
jgi:hypothetical protein